MIFKGYSRPGPPLGQPGAMSRGAGARAGRLLGNPLIRGHFGASPRGHRPPTEGLPRGPGAAQASNIPLISSRLLKNIIETSQTTLGMDRKALRRSLQAVGGRCRFA